jgi:hypothetical protein
MPEADPKLLCRFCLTPVVSGARKCPACHEYLDETVVAAAAAREQRTAFRKAVADVAAKAILPLITLAIVLLFRTEISTKLLNTESMQVGNYGIKFAFPKARGGFIELEPYALYFLLDAAQNPEGYSGGLNYDALSPEKRAAIATLEQERLVSVTRETVSDKEAKKRFGIKSSISLTITDKGKDFLRATKLDRILPSTPQGAVPQTKGK